MNNGLVIALFLLCVFCSSCSQILLKLGALRGHQGLRAYVNPHVMGGYCIFSCITLCSTILYRYLPISLGALLDCSGYVFVAALSVVFLKEKWNKKRTLGLVFVVSGILFALW